MLLYLVLIVIILSSLQLGSFYSKFYLYISQRLTLLLLLALIMTLYVECMHYFNLIAPTHIMHE